VATRAIETRETARATPRETAGRSDSRARRYDPAETRARVLAAAYMLFSSKGFAATGTADIAREADVSEGSIFYHFGSKQKLLEELGRRHGELMIAYMQGDDALEDLEPGIIVPRVFEFVRANSMWEGMTGETSQANARTKLMKSADVEPFYHAAKDTVVEWVERHMTAAFAKRGIKGIEIDLAASFTHLFVGEAIDRIFATDDVEEQLRVERETIRFMRAACLYEA